MLSIDEVLEVLAGGGICVLPTDTLYGLTCLASNQAAVTRLYSLKHRQHKPGTLIAANIDQFVELGIPRRYIKPVEQFWPNPISIIIPVGNDLNYLHQGKGTLALRIPRSPELCSLLERTGPLLTSSANVAGQPPANTIREAERYFGDKVDFYVDGGDLSGHKPSTILRVLDDAIEIIREGAINVNEAGEIVDEL